MLNFRLFAYLFFALLFFSCDQQKDKKVLTLPVEPVNIDSTIIVTDTTNPKEVVKIGAFEQQLIDAGLVNIQLLDSTILVDLKYSSMDNFLGVDVYGDLTHAYLQPDVAEKLTEAQRFLKELHPTYSLLVFDAVRPKSVQQKMWDTLKIPVAEKTKFLSNPKYGSLHNFGAAVDISIADSTGKELDMGTPFDFMGELAYPTKEWKMLQEGQLTEQQVNNRKLLRSVMRKAGFFNIQTEWWHFNSCYRKEALKKYEIIE